MEGTTTITTKKKTIGEVEVAGKRVLMRVDFNVPLDDSGQITDDRRIRLALPSIKSVLDRGGRLALISHLGRPQASGPEPALSLAPVGERLESLLDGVPVRFVAGDCAGPAAAAAVEDEQAKVVLLDNLRFHPGEKAGDAEFAAKLAAFGDIYCNDAFGTAHRDDASMVALPRAMAGKPRVAGLLMEREIKYMAETIANPQQPFVAVLGGAKVSDKLGVIHNLMGKVETILVGGAMAYTFIRAMEHGVGSSLVQLGMLKKAREIIDEAAASPTDLILPTDHVCGKQMTRVTPLEVFSESIPEGWMGLDIGPETTGRYVERLHRAKTVVWNGPMGAFEIQPFDVGTRQVAEGIVKATSAGATSIVGGGDTAAAVERFGLDEKFSHVSTGGGAALQMLEGRAFASIEALDGA